MGYYTNYKIEIVSGGNNEIDYEEDISEHSEYGGGSNFEEELKWYGHEEDMVAYSKKHPNTVFKLSGEGEESDDLWVTYYKNGKTQNSRAIITYEEYDESKLS